MYASEFGAYFYINLISRKGWMILRLDIETTETNKSNLEVFYF